MHGFYFKSWYRVIALPLQVYPAETEPDIADHLVGWLPKSARFLTTPASTTSKLTCIRSDWFVSSVLFALFVSVFFSTHFFCFVCHRISCRCYTLSTPERLTSSINRMSFVSRRLGSCPYLASHQESSHAIATQHPEMRWQFSNRSCTSRVHC